MSKSAAEQHFQRAAEQLHAQRSLAPDDYAERGVRGDNAIHHSILGLGYALLEISNAIRDAARAPVTVRVDEAQFEHLGAAIAAVEEHSARPGEGGAR